MALFPGPFDTLLRLQQALGAFRASDWLEAGPSGSGSHPPCNVFRTGDDYIIITEVPGIKKSDLGVQIKGRTVRLSGTKSVDYDEKASVHRRERLAGRFDRAITLPFEINADGVKAECRDGILALFLPRVEADKPRSISIT
jgi:HSP20 family protein